MARLFEVTLFPFLNPITIAQGDTITLVLDEFEREYHGKFIGVMGDNVFIEHWSGGYIVGDIGIPLINISSIRKNGEVV